jgi:hypothetical protein
MSEDIMFRGKSILFLSPSFFGYETAIKDKLVDLGASVFYIDDRPSNSSITKGIIRVHKDLAKYSIDKYYNRIAEEIIDQEFDVVFLLNPEALPLTFLDVCKSRWPSAYYVMYMWDSIKNRKHTLEFLPYCDRVFTFEREDANTYGFNFKPLFYLDAYEAVREGYVADEYDLCFMGTAHSDRYGIAREVRDWCEEQGLRCFFYFYIQGMSLYWFNKLKNKGLIPSMAEVSFEKMSFADVVRVVGASRAVLDIQHPRQTGLTMRTLETLGAGKKLVTTNAHVKEYDFYDVRQVQVVDRLNPVDVLEVDFFRDVQCYVPLDKVNFCSIGNWLQEIILYI